MRKIMTVCAVMIGCFLSAQSVTFSKVERAHENSDKFLYRIPDSIAGAFYLGELEVQGFNSDDAEVFSKVYKKAKEIGANAFGFRPALSIDGSEMKINTRHYKLSLFYVDAVDFPKDYNKVYFVSSSAKPQKFRFSDEEITLAPRSYTARQLAPGTVYTLTTGKLFGSTIKLSAAPEQPSSYFQLSAFKIGADQQNSGLKIKTGDIVLLEKSFAQFLTLLYEEQ